MVVRIVHERACGFPERGTRARIRGAQEGVDRAFARSFRAKRVPVTVSLHQGNRLAAQEFTETGRDSAHHHRTKPSGSITLT